MHLIISKKRNKKKGRKPNPKGNRARHLFCIRTTVSWCWANERTETSLCDKPERFDCCRLCTA